MSARLLAAVILAASCAVAAGVTAGEKARCEVLTIQASNEGGGIDPALAEHAHVFGKAPFNAFDTFKLVHRQQYEMELRAPTALKLPERLGGTLRLNELSTDALDLTLTIARAGRRPVNVEGKASPGAPLFAAGFAGAGGTWIFGVVCTR